MFTHLERLHALVRAADRRAHPLEGDLHHRLLVHEDLPPHVVVVAERRVRREEVEDDVLGARAPARVSVIWGAKQCALSSGEART